MKKVFVIFSFLASLLVFAALPQTTQAACTEDPAKNVYCCDDVQTSVKFPNCKQGETGITSILLMVLDFMAVGVGIAVVAGIAWGGFIYAQAGGDAGKTKEAISIITNAIIGLALFLGMWALANFFVPGGLFN